MDQIINTNHLFFRYHTDEENVINKLNLSIEKGQFVVILGPNGSGKSTLAKLFNGILLPAEGTVVVDNILTTDQGKIWSIRQQLGIVFQNPDNQFVANTVEEDVAFGLENSGVDPIVIQERVNDTLAKVDMFEHKNKEPHHLSGGQKQKVAIAGILAMKPKVIVFDEATSMLDPKGRKDIINITKDLNQDGVTIIHITHHLEEALQADRVIVMNHGVIALDGSPKEVFKNADLLKRIGLDVPITVELANRLRQKGFSLSENIVFEEEIIKELWTFL